MSDIISIQVGGRYVQQTAEQWHAHFDRSRTADQEANVQGGERYVTFKDTGIYVDLARYFATPEGKAALHKFDPAAPHPTPAPASGEVTDALIAQAEDVIDRFHWMVSPDAKGFHHVADVSVLAVMKLANDVRLYLEAATRARKGERKKTCTHCNGAGCPYCHGEGDVYATNAADAEAYRAVTLDDCLAIEARCQYPADVLFSELQRIGAVIPTAAPDRADIMEQIRICAFADPEPDCTVETLLGWLRSLFKGERPECCKPNAAPVPADEGEKEG